MIFAKVPAENLFHTSSISHCQTTAFVSAYRPQKYKAYRHYFLVLSPRALFLLNLPTHSVRPVCFCLVRGDIVLHHEHCVPYEL